MISPANGEVTFSDGLCIAAHDRINDFSGAVVSNHPHPVAGWHQYIFGFLVSDYGRFQVEAAVNELRRVEAVFLSHCDPLYHADKPDPGRIACHQSIIATDLLGQKDFPWGHTFCRFDPESKRDWLVVVFNPFINVPLQSRSAERQLTEHEPTPPNDWQPHLQKPRPPLPLRD
jgi:hypothetical protein